MTSEREILTWEVFGSASRELAKMVADDYEPDMILSIARVLRQKDSHVTSDPASLDSISL